MPTVPDHPSDANADAILDVLIVGAGLSGIGAACRLQQRCPNHRFAILEGRERLGGTWDLFRYPGVRSDSDMYTLGFPFRPWGGEKSIADGPDILRYLQDTAAEHGIGRHIRYRHAARSADWSSADKLWTVTLQRGDEAELIRLRCRFLFLCGGYYSYARGYTPDFPGMADFAGTIVHPQDWPQALDYAGKRVVIIGSGATAVTLAPAMAETAAHVTLLQRSPTYMVARPARDPVAARLRGRLPERLAHGLLRWKNLLLGMLVFRMARRRPERIKALLLGELRQALGPQADIARDFTPRYKPWEQRLCLVPDGDLFKAVRAQKVAMVTDHVACFTPTGIRLKSGAELGADIIVTATGLQLQAANGLVVSLDGVAVRPGNLVTYKGAMYRDLPNLAAAFGYTNASWTLKADLTANWVCRLLRHMESSGAKVVTPRSDEADMALKPWVDFSSGYFQRSLDVLPKQGQRQPWILSQNYLTDLMALKFGRIADGHLRFEP